jgi:hypothetical protein
MNAAKTLLAAMTTISALSPNGLSYMNDAENCALCKSRGLDKNEDGESVCPSCPYYEFSIVSDPEGGLTDNG